MAGVMITAVSSDIWLSLTSMPVIPADTGAFHGAPQSYIDKALEVASAIQGLPNPPEGFRAFIVPGQGSQTIAGSWYQVPNGWIELKNLLPTEAYRTGIRITA